MQKKFLVSISVFLIVFLGLNLKIRAQKNLKYKDVYKAVVERSKEEAYSMLLTYQKQHPHHANTYFQLGLIAQYWSKDYDALTDIKAVKYFIYNTNLYYGLANLKADEKNVRKNKDYYKNVNELKEIEKLKLEDVKSFVDVKLAANKEYKKNIEIVTNYFNRSIAHYNNCVRIFKDINQQHMKIKNIYLTADDKFIEKLDNLANSFDSTIFYLQNYQTALKNYPIKDYHQKYKLFPIETYRLEGLTGTDFLKDEIHLWNYGAWVKDLKAVLGNDISQLRKDINNANKDLDRYIKKISNSKSYKSDFKEYKVDEKLINRVGKFDYNSLLVPLFKYKEAKEAFMAKTKSPVNNPKDTTNSYNNIQKARYYIDLLKSKQYADSLNNVFIRNISEDGLKKYTRFFEDNYGGQAGLVNYSQSEVVFLNKELDKAFGNFKNYLLRELLFQNPIITLPYRKSNIELKIVNQLFAEAESGKYYITSFSKDNSGNYYAAGYIKQRNPGVSAFVLKTSKLDRIEWLKIYPIRKTSDDYGAYIQATETGCELLVTSIKNTEIQNHIIRIDNTGKQIIKKGIDIGLVPRYFNYDEINQDYLIAFKGMAVDDFDCLSDNLVINSYNGSSFTENWSSILNIKGNLVNIIKMNESLFVFTNFTKFAAGSKIISSKAGVQNNETNSLLFVLNNSGQTEQTVPYSSELPFFIAKALKINSNTINLFGFNQVLISTRTAKKEDFAKPIFLLVNAKGDIYFDNRKN